MQLYEFDFKLINKRQCVVGFTLEDTQIDNSLQRPHVSWAQLQRLRKRRIGLVQIVRSKIECAKIGELGRIGRVEFNRGREKFGRVIETAKNPPVSG